MRRKNKFKTWCIFPLKKLHRDKKSTKSWERIHRDTLHKKAA